MDDPINEKISCLLDEELDKHQALSLLHILHKETDLRRQLERYQIASYALSSKKYVPIKHNFLHGIQKGIANEPIYLHTPSKKSHNTMLAFAACIGMFTVIAFSTLYHQTPKMNTMSSPNMVENDKAKKISIQSQDIRFNNYLQTHNNSLYTNGAVRVSPYTQTASYQKN